MTSLSKHLKGVVSNTLIIVHRQSPQSSPKCVPEYDIHFELKFITESTLDHVSFSFTLSSYCVSLSPSARTYILGGGGAEQ